MSIITSKTVTNLVNNKNLSKAATAITTGASLIPVVMLEATVLAGRTHQAFKRGGAIEGKESISEEFVSSVGWLAGIPVLNKAGDFAINKTLNAFKIPNINFDIGKDAVRNPMADAIGHLPQKQKNLLMGLKLGKIVLSSVATVYFMGMILPKFLHKQTKERVEKQKQQQLSEINPKQNSHKKVDNQMFRSHQTTSMEDFVRKTKGNNNTSQKSNPSFKGFDNLANTVLYNMENNHVVNLLTVDAGLFAGRVHSARNVFEKIEKLFRDLSSSFFYVAATPLIIFGLNKIDPLKGKNSRLDPVTADKVNNLILNPTNKKVLDWRNMDEIPLEEFQRGLFGTYRIDKKTALQAQTLGENGIIPLKTLSKFIDENVADKNTAELIKENALKLSKLQPQKAGESIITTSQIKSVFKDGLLNDGNIINDLINNATAKKALDHTKFVSQKKIDSTRKHIIEYCESIAAQAKKENLSSVTPEFLQKMKNRNLVTKLGYWGAGMAVSALFLSIIIPKTQCLISKKLTKQDGFVGIMEDYENSENKKLNKNA